tara:strand:- start:12450 stop:13325 length:876 start_codon:yes stop_codon:yes gene_type:complete
MAYEDISQNGMNYITLRQLINDYIITLDGDDYTANASDSAIRNFALRGIREFGFDVTSRVKSLKLDIHSNGTAILPDDYVDLVKVGVIGSDGIVRVFNQNKNINYSRQIEQDSSADDVDSPDVDDTITTTDSAGGPLDIDSNLILDRDDAKSATTSNDNSYVFDNFVFQGGIGRLYGAGGAKSPGSYRVNLDQNRLEIDAGNSASEIVLEYIADEARSTNPVIHIYAEEAIRSYIYYKLCERKSTVPGGEKSRARAEYYNERRKAKARLGNFTKNEALKVLRKNFMLAPKY